MVVPSGEMTGANSLKGEFMFGPRFILWADEVNDRPIPKIKRNTNFIGWKSEELIR